jgi:hypothetical protein
MVPNLDTQELQRGTWIAWHQRYSLWCSRVFVHEPGANGGEIWCTDERGFMDGDHVLFCSESEEEFRAMVEAHMGGGDTGLPECQRCRGVTWVPQVPINPDAQPPGNPKRWFWDAGAGEWRETKRFTFAPKETETKNPT